MASGHGYRANRPNTWLLRPTLQSEDSSCQPGAVHTWPMSDIRCVTLTSAFAVPAQLVDATQALNLSAGVSNCKVSRGRSLADEPLYSDRLASAPTSQCPSESTV